jgi:methionyl-tRNA formyltransferase
VRLVFLGTPEAAVPTLDALVGAGHDVALVITRPDRKRGRGAHLTPSPVKTAAERLGLGVSHRLADALGVGAERGVVVAFGAIIPTAMLDALPMLNVHFSLLPRWRGAAPVQRAILAGDEATGVSIISLEPTLDTGPIHLAREVAIDDSTAAALTECLARVGARALLEVLASPELLAHPAPQVGTPSYAAKMERDEYRLRRASSAEMASRTIRLGRAYFMLDDKRVGVLGASLGDEDQPAGTLGPHGATLYLGFDAGALALGLVRPEGRAEMPARAWWDGLRPAQLARSWS